MGKFAGFLKRAKKLSGYGVGLLSGVNDIYKGVKPFGQSVIGALPFGGVINKGLNIGSKIIDKVQPITRNWIENDDKEKIKGINDNIKRYGGDLTQKVLNNYLDTQENIFNNKGNFSLDDYGDSIFGNPLN